MVTRIYNESYTVEPHLTVTSLVRKPPHYSHPGSVPNCIPQCKYPPCNKVTSPLRSLLPSPVGDLNSEVPLYLYEEMRCRSRTSSISSVYGGTSLLWSPTGLDKSDPNGEVTVFQGVHCTVEYNLGLSNRDRNGEVTLLVR